VVRSRCVWSAAVVVADAVVSSVTCALPPVIGSRSLSRRLCLATYRERSAAPTRRAVTAQASLPGSDATEGRAEQLPAWPSGYGSGCLPPAQPCFVSQKILLISSIFPRRSSALATSVLPLVPAAPASLVASLNSVLSCGYFSKCGGLK
jgi:hypothetical protein